MSEIYTAAHTENVIDLYELRLSWLEETDIGVNEFNSVEERLNANIYSCEPEKLNATQVITPQSAKPKKPPVKEPECFVFLASHINAHDVATSNAGYNLAYEWLTLDDNKSAAAEAALALYPEADPGKLIKLYEENETLRPLLMRLFRKQMIPLQLELVITAATAETAATALKVETLKYAAARTDIGLDVFRTHYVPLLSGRTQFDASIVEAALWGGMVRGDADATKAISAVLSHAGSAADHAKFMRLAALSGHADFLALLLMAAENNPDTGYPLLVLFGQKSVMPEILKGLENAHTMEHAASAYRQLTDQNLPRLPRMSVVGEEETEPTEDSPDIPDIKAAQDWWANHQAKWKEGERWLFGKPATTAHLTTLTKKHAGQFGCDVMALLALANKAPLNIPTEIWRTRQQQLLAKQGNSQHA